MSILQFPINHTDHSFVDNAPHLTELIDEVINDVTEVIAPVWPLQDYVAVNPLGGIAHRSFMDARAFLRVFADCETLMPTEHYVAEFQKGRFTAANIETAMAELASAGVPLNLSVSQIVERMQMAESTKATEAATNPDRRLHTIAEFASGTDDFQWTEVIVDEVSKHCAAHYDQGQSAWPSPYRKLPLYQAWRSAAQHDLNVEILGLKGFRAFVAHLPHTPAAAIAYTLHRLEVPVHLWTTFLLCQAFSIPGWMAWTKYQTHWTDEDGAASNDLVGLLAIRLAYDAALAEAKALRVNWAFHASQDFVSSPLSSTETGDDAWLRFVLLRASEIGYRDQLLGSLSLSHEEGETAGGDQKLAQMIFCIDVRSERIRRQLESQCSDIETFGFAGFFGMAMEFVELGQESGTSQLPVLLKPQFKLLEGMSNHTHSVDATVEALVARKCQQQRTWMSLWKSFQGSAVSCFSFVETTGLLYGWELLKRAIGYKAASVVADTDGLSARDREQIGPTLRGLNQQGMTRSRQVDMAHDMLRNIGIVKDFAKLVVFCGHACQTENNPLAAGLDCGACGGHSGEPNARFAALLLNQPYIRQALAGRGIEIPEDTHFLAALHNTTTDEMEFFDVNEVPSPQLCNLQELVSSCAMASKKTRLERMPIVASQSLGELLRRASDWSEVRPEWGLAGNAAFIVAPRTVTKNANLDARSFLHSYDYTQDAEGKVLEAIMTGPMIVANWINLQYYASTVDNRYFGSGNKTVHNVVGRFGILSGNGGDLMTGLPWQSLHTGAAYQHLPMRLQVVMAAPRAMIDRVINQHGLVANLIQSTWLHLVAIEDGLLYRYGNDGAWNRMNPAQAVPTI